jgi:hypothetical protein
MAKQPMSAEPIKLAQPEFVEEIISPEEREKRVLMLKELSRVIRETAKASRPPGARAPDAKQEDDWIKRGVALENLQAMNKGGALPKRKGRADA